MITVGEVAEHWDHNADSWSKRVRAGMDVFAGELFYRSLLRQLGGQQILVQEGNRSADPVNSATSTRLALANLYQVRRQLLPSAASCAL